MEHKGQVYRFVGVHGLIRPDEWGIARKDVLFNRKDYDIKLGDRVVYEHYESKGRRHAKNLKKVDT